MNSTVSLGIQGMGPSERPEPPELPCLEGASDDAVSSACGPDSNADQTPRPITHSSTSNPLMLGLLLQQESIRNQQQHLLEMSSAVEAAIRGETSTLLYAQTMNKLQSMSSNWSKLTGGAGSGYQVFGQGKDISAKPISGTYLPVERKDWSQQQHPQTSATGPENGMRGQDSVVSWMSPQVSNKSAKPTQSRKNLNASGSQKALPTIANGTGSASCSDDGASNDANPMSSTWLYKEEAQDDRDCDAILNIIGHSGEDETLKKMVLRVKTRLGINNSDSRVTAARLHKTLLHLGARRWSFNDCKELLLMVQEHVVSFADYDYHPVGEVVPFKFFARVLFMQTDEMNNRFKDDVIMKLLACREILLSADANRLVAELTQVHVDDLAQPVKVDHLTDWLEPVMSIVIIMNGVTIGWQANINDSEAEETWFWIDSLFTVLFLGELLLKLYYRGMSWFLHGSDRCWNFFDSILVGLGFLDMILTAVWSISQGTAVFSVVRVVRLVRLTRLFRVFRMKQMKELSLMLAGVVAGMRTLLWAMILLFSAVYILGILATISLSGKEPEKMDGDDMFESVPMSMFTVFRCLMGDGMDAQGRPIVYLYAESFGAPFVLGYVCSMTFIVFGVFNLIFAIYIESTLAAARTQRKMDRKESVRVARMTRELLKKFALAQTLLGQQDSEKRELYGESREFKQRMRRSSQGVEINEGELLISRELFTLVLSDPEVQTLLDALDISSDRTHLFDILDADGSGDIEATELIKGLLRVRGEAKKSDVVANLLAVRAAQNMIRNLEKQQQEHYVNVAYKLETLQMKE